MPEAIDNLYRVLNDLIATCRDAEEGYGKAAKGVHSDELRDLLTRYSSQRADFAGELESLTRNQGRDPETTGRIGGVLHRGWVDLETRIRPKSDEEFIDNCLDGDTATLNHYERALADPLPPSVRAVLDRHVNLVRRALNEFRTFLGRRTAP